MSNNKDLLNEYNKLKDEFEEHKVIAQEYETELENTNKEYEEKIKELKATNEKLLKEISKIKEDFRDIKEKNIEKMKEIDYLEKQISKLKANIDNNTSDKSVFEKRLIMLENENNDYTNKARELECWVDDLKNKLDAALEENIILHSENETNKSEMQEIIQRLQQELEESKNEITSKDKIINGMTMHRDFLIKTAYNAQDDINNNVIDKGSKFQNMKTTSNGKFINVLTPVNNNKKIPDKFMQSYSKTFFDVQGNGNNNQEENSKYEIWKDEYEIESNRQSFVTSEQEDFKSTTKFQINNTKRISNTQLEKYLKGSTILNENEKFNPDDDEEEKEFIRLKIDTEIKNILESRKNFILNTLTHENFSFDILSNIRINSHANSAPPTSEIIKREKYNNCNKNIKLSENIDDILSKIQARKEKVILQKKVLQNKLEKVGIKIF